MQAPSPGKTAFLFPGQGAQAVGMGKDLYDASPKARAVFEAADQALGYSLSRLCFEGPAETLTQTIHTQPAILTVSIACLAAAEDVLNRNGVLKPAFVAGHSLGEYTALVAANSLSFEDAVRLVQERGRLMQKAGEQRSGTMGAVLGLDEAVLAEVCRETGAEMANLNAPGQIVISGDTAAVERALALAQERGARRVIPLQVSGAFHSALMEPAIDGLRRAVAAARFSPPAVPVVANSTALPISGADALPEELVQQIRMPVQWHRTIQYMESQGVSRYVEIGPGKVLTGLVKRIQEGAETINLGQVAEIEALGAD